MTWLTCATLFFSQYWSSGRCALVLASPDQEKIEISIEGDVGGWE